MLDEQTQNLSERIALLLQENERGSDAKLFRQSLEKINERLNSIESQLTALNPKSKIQSPVSLHSSQEKFTNLERLADQIIDSMQNEKACPFEPAGKPCDDCAMCNSRGF